MKTKLAQSIPTLVALLIVGFGYFSEWCVASGMCYRTAIDRIIPEVTYPLLAFAIFFLPVAIVLIFVKQPIFKYWLKFTAWAVPLSILFVVATPTTYTGLGPNFFPFYRTDAARLAGQVFLVASLLLIAWKYFSLRRNSKLEQPAP